MSSSVTEAEIWQVLFLIALGIVLLPLFIVIAAASLAWVLRAAVGGIMSSLYIGKHRKGEEMFDRPAETITAIIATLVGAWQIIVGLLDDGFQITDLSDPELTGILTVIIGYVAAVVTWYIARRQRDPAGDLNSASDGTVVSAK